MSDNLPFPHKHNTKHSRYNMHCHSSLCSSQSHFLPLSPHTSAERIVRDIGNTIHKIASSCLPFIPHLSSIAICLYVIDQQLSGAIDIDALLFSIAPLLFYRAVIASASIRYGYKNRSICLLSGLCVCLSLMPPSVLHSAPCHLFFFLFCLPFSRSRL